MTNQLPPNPHQVGPDAGTFTKWLLIGAAVLIGVPLLIDLGIGTAISALAAIALVVGLPYLAIRTAYRAGKRGGKAVGGHVRGYADAIQEGLAEGAAQAQQDKQVPPLREDQ